MKSDSLEENAEGEKHYMIHLRSNEKFLCDKSLNELLKIDPNGTVIELVITTIVNEDAISLRRRFDIIAQRANCPECRKAYSNLNLETKI